MLCHLRLPRLVKDYGKISLWNSIVAVAGSWQFCEMTSPMYTSQSCTRIRLKVLNVAISMKNILFLELPLLGTATICTDFVNTPLWWVDHRHLTLDFYGVDPQT
jgi:hypothetical protein